MSDPSPQTRKLIVTLLLTFLILSFFVLSGFTVVSYDTRSDRELPPNQGPGAEEAGYSVIDQTAPPDDPAGEIPAPQADTDEQEEAEEPTRPTFRLTNAIRNGDFEQNPTSDVATHWQPFNNGGAIYGWYREEWEEAVHSGQRSQLLEINRVDSYRPNRIIAIYQTVDVVPNATYSLTIHALMRSAAPIELRNQGDYAMQWGIDFKGTGKHNMVVDWVTMPLTEQLRLGSNGTHTHDMQRLFFQRIYTTVKTINTSRLTLFIRGVKIEPTGTEVDFNVDDVSLVGPYFPTPTPTPPAPRLIPSTGIQRANDERPIPASAPIQLASELPDAGASLPGQISGGVLALGGFILIVLGASAANNIIQKSKTRK